MKKVLYAFIVVIISFSLMGCSSTPRTVEEACEKADKMVAKWSDKNRHMCRYYSEFIEENGTQIYLVEAQDITVEDLVGDAKHAVARVVSDFVYEELSPVFENFPEVSIGVAILDEDDETYYLTNNGEVIFNAYE